MLTSSCRLLDAPPISSWKFTQITKRTKKATYVYGPATATHITCVTNHVLKIVFYFTGHPVRKTSVIPGGVLTWRHKTDRRSHCYLICLWPIIAYSLHMGEVHKLKSQWHWRREVSWNQRNHTPPPSEQTVAPWRPTELGALPRTDRPMDQKSTNQKPRYVMWNESGGGHFRSDGGWKGEEEKAFCAATFTAGDDSGAGPRYDKME